MNKALKILGIMAFLSGFAVSCKPPTVLVYYMGGMVHDDLSGNEEDVKIAVLRYQKKDTLQYLFDHYADLDYPREIECPYVCYMPKEQTGVLGVHAGQDRWAMPLLLGRAILPMSEIQDYQDMEKSSEVCYIPIYRYQISDTVISFSKMTHDERMADKYIFSSIYAKGKWLISKNYFATEFGDSQIIPEVRVVFANRYRVNYKYLNGSDTINQYYMNLNLGDNSIASIPMFHFPLPTNVYYKKHLVKKRNGFWPSEPDIDRLADYRHEIDTAQLALPVRIFQEQYIQTNDIYCLDGLSVPFKRD